MNSLRNFITNLSVGGVYSGLFYRKNNEYYTFRTGLITLFSSLILVFLSVSVIVDIVNHKQINVQVEMVDQYDYNINKLTSKSGKPYTLIDFGEISLISFKVIAYSF